LPSQLQAGTRWVDVNVATQTARLMIGNTAVYTADVTTGKDGFETPQGDWSVQYNVLNETMTSSQAGINNPAEQYDVKNVLYTQYFDGYGDALHLNYWQPLSTFGNARTSHGCVGLDIQDAQYFWMFGDTGMRVRISSNGVVTQPPPTQAPAPPTPTRAAPTRTATPRATVTSTSAATAVADDAAADTATSVPALRTPTPFHPANTPAGVQPGLATATPRPTQTPVPIGTAQPQQNLITNTRVATATPARGAH
jgi:hypothetical protein